MRVWDDLTRALAAATIRGRELHVFFRDDDADDDLSNLHLLIDTFCARSMPINLEIVPGTLTERGAALLRRSHKEADGLIELNQHGWVHVNHEPDGRKCEFGPSRTYRQQLDDIRRGREVLDQAFGAGWSAVFTPPWNRCTSDTMRALEELGFEAISKDGPQPIVTEHRLPEISVTFDIYTWKHGPCLKPESEIVRALAAQVNTNFAIGILLHHKVMTAETFTCIANLLDELRRWPTVNIHTFRSALTHLCRKEPARCNV